MYFVTFSNRCPFIVISGSSLHSTVVLDEFIFNPIVLVASSSFVNIWESSLFSKIRISITYLRLFNRSQFIIIPL